jgi:hypothetical protein
MPFARGIERLNSLNVEARSYVCRIVSDGGVG